MKSINKVFLVGHLGANPEMQMSKNGKSYAKLSLATNRRYKDPQGEWKELTQWHRITVWGPQSQVCANGLKKGSPVCVEGYISNFETQDEKGHKQLRTFITAEEISFIGNRSTERSEAGLPS